MLQVIVLCYNFVHGFLFWLKLPTQVIATSIATSIASPGHCNVQDTRRNREEAAQKNTLWRLEHQRPCGANQGTPALWRWHDGDGRWNPGDLKESEERNFWAHTDTALEHCAWAGMPHHAVLEASRDSKPSRQESSLRERLKDIGVIDKTPFWLGCWQGVCLCVSLLSLAFVVPSLPPPVANSW